MHKQLVSVGKLHAMVEHLNFQNEQKRQKEHKRLMAIRQQPSPLLYSIDIRPARNSRLTQRETNHYIARCASVLAWFYLAERFPAQLVVRRPFCTASAIRCMLSI